MQQRWQEQLARRGAAPLPVTPANGDQQRRGGGTTPVATQPAEPPKEDPRFPMKVDLTVPLNRKLRAVSYSLNMRYRATWWGFFLAIVRSPLRLPLKFTVWIGKFYMKWSLRRFAERGLASAPVTVGEREDICRACPDLKTVDDALYCGGCDCPTTPRAALSRKWRMHNCCCPKGRWPGTWPAHVGFSLRVLGQACTTCGGK